ncbi:cyclic pyranopterin phosphate synthase [Orbus hercynius]|uniref:GTP 3',8-cyclase n=1 Tax=Orbus hercynius TaxID=593135 RepID=A0A495RFM2_9GAMM|nr:GTP 3',8-cyclase MoaA [Orbus hercynius]RKS86054.1 cyclic pyranopterin phosphate synthase [Orbus hercynius]
MQQQLVDNYQRRFQYLRLSLTELCNFRCQYCLPNGYQPNRAHQFLTLNEIANIANVFSDLGVQKIRLTGGEPTLRRDFADIIMLLAKQASIKEIAVTTNGDRLLNRITQWQQAGLTALNVSIDSFSPARFALITGENKLHQVLAGIDRALEIGMQKVKINTVLMKGLTDGLNEYLPWIKDRRVDLRFIELMETGEGSAHFNRFHLSGTEIEQQLVAQGWQLMDKDKLAGPAKVYQHRDYQGRVGLIMPYSKNFCQSCNRLRVSSIGKLHYCLFGDSAIDLRDLLQDSSQQALLKARILASLRIKPETHFLHQHHAGITPNLSYIGG